MTRSFTHQQLEVQDVLILTDRLTKEVRTTSLIVEITYKFADVMTVQLLTTCTDKPDVKYTEFTYSGSQRVIHRNSSSMITILRDGQVLYQST